MERPQFERLVGQALDAIPDRIKSHIENVDVLVEEWPSKNQLVGSGINEGEAAARAVRGRPR